MMHCAKKPLNSNSGLADGENLDEILPEVFATVREVGKRTVRYAPFRCSDDRWNHPSSGQDR